MGRLGVQRSYSVALKRTLPLATRSRLFAHWQLKAVAMVDATSASRHASKAPCRRFFTPELFQPRASHWLSLVCERSRIGGMALVTHVMPSVSRAEMLKKKKKKKKKKEPCVNTLL